MHRKVTEVNSVVTEHRRSQSGKEWKNNVEGCESESNFMRGNRQIKRSCHVSLPPGHAGAVLEFVVSVIKDSIGLCVDAR
jgi:hypothetical protein